MTTVLEELDALDPTGHRDRARAELRVAVTEAVLLVMERQGVTKTALAGRMGISRSAITQALASTRNLSLNTLADIAEALNLRIDFGIHDRAVAPPIEVSDWPLASRGSVAHGAILSSSGRLVQPLFRSHDLPTFHGAPLTEPEAAGGELLQLDFASPEVDAGAALH